jgi:hypothetical protein
VLAGDDLERLIGGRERVLALEAHIERGAHQHHRGEPGHHRAGQPGEAQLAALGNFAVGGGDRQRRPVFKPGPHQSERAIALRRIHPRSCPVPVINYPAMPAVSAPRGP